MPRIELVYFAGCPHVDDARAALRNAARHCGLAEPWTEVDLDSEPVPEHARGRPSPTVLVDGRDVEGDGQGDRGRCCRAGGAPTVEAIVRALEEATPGAVRRPRRTSDGSAAF